MEEKVVHSYWHIGIDGLFHHYALTMKNGINNYYVDGALIKQVESKIIYETSDMNSSKDRNSVS